MNLKIKCQCGSELNDIGVGFINSEIQLHYYKNLNKTNVIENDYLIYNSKTCPTCLKLFS